jgi:hypothetical protein
VTSNWNWYILGAIFWNILYVHSMNHSKDNSRNNYLIFKSNYFFFFLKKKTLLFPINFFNKYLSTF